MKKIPTLFKREFENHNVVRTLPEVTEGLEWVLNGDGEATLKWDGACCAIIDGKFYKRYDAKKGKKPPEGAIPCCEPDAVTGHWPHWVEVDENNPADKWFLEAFNNLRPVRRINATYEAIGIHFQGNPYHLTKDILIRHGDDLLLDCPRTFEGIKDYLRNNSIEGIVFWKDGDPMCKIKRTDFGYEWPIKEREHENNL